MSSSFTLTDEDNVTPPNDRPRRSRRLPGRFRDPIQIPLTGFTRATPLLATDIHSDAANCSHVRDEHSRQLQVSLSSSDAAYLPICTVTSANKFGLTRSYLGALPKSAPESAYTLEDFCTLDLRSKLTRVSQLDDAECY